MNQNIFKNSVYEDMTESELAVAEFLANNGLWWNYEQPVFVTDDKGRPRVWTPDFYIPDLGLYVEVVGNNYADYSFREEVYDKNRIPIVFVYPNKPGWQNHLSKKIFNIHQDRWEVIKRFTSF